ncbi:MAG: CHY zinc finger protein [Pyrinomonadaceae bacterium]
MRSIHGEKVNGINVDANTRCEHYHSDIDIIAIKFKCCGQWFPCYECHAAVADHEAKVWTLSEFDTEAILCGNCGEQLSITEYMDGGSACTKCRYPFNPGCSNHYHLYFEQAT